MALGFVITFVLATAAQGANGFTSTGSLGTARYEHTATLLLSGKVLVVGGRYGSDLGSAELYNPATGTWSPTGSLLGGGIRDFTATLLPNGKVLVAGGAFGSPGYEGESSAAELYDPATGAWSPTGSLHIDAPVTRPRCCPTARSSSREAARRHVWPARNCMIRPPAPGRSPAASAPRAPLTRPRCCPTARCSSREATTDYFGDTRQRGAV